MQCQQVGLSRLDPAADRRSVTVFARLIPVALMSEIPDQHTLLDEIELRQDDLLRQLDHLNGRIEVVLREQSAAMGIPYKNAALADQNAAADQPAAAADQSTVAANQPAAATDETAADRPSVAAIQMPGLVDGPQQPDGQHQADEAA